MTSKDKCRGMIASLTPNDKGCQILMTDRLKKIGFEVDNLKFGEVDNFWLQSFSRNIALSGT
jgi:hypothetical protein